MHDCPYSIMSTTRNLRPHHAIAIEVHAGQISPDIKRVVSRLEVSPPRHHPLAVRPLGNAQLTLRHAGCFVTTKVSGNAVADTAPG